MNFSSRDRSSFLFRLKNESFDLLVIGGGITGAGIALDAASRGLKVALIDKSDFAFGTSSRSTKLIHGGLRYLKQLEFGLVKEVGSERAIVHKLAPHLVVPEKMLLPLHEKKGLGYWLTSIGLKVYDFLAGVQPEDQRRMLTRHQTLKAEPLLRNNDVKGGALYAEYRTDDARLTIEIIKAAAHHGALLLNYVAAEEFVYTDQHISGITATDQFNQTSFTVHAKAVVNATGPWVDELRERNNSRTGKRLHLTKGIHIVLPHYKLPVRQAIYFDVGDGRMIFAIPRGRVTYAGTTDTDYDGDKNNVVATRDDAAYLIRAINAMFPVVALKPEDIESSWAGLRPLIFEEGKSASELSRKDEIFESQSGLISIAGGKLTGYRKMAERVVNLVIRRHFAQYTLKKVNTHHIKLASSDWDTKEVKRYIHAVATQFAVHNLSFVAAQELVERYGMQTKIICAEFEQLANIHPAPLALLLAQLKYGIRHEMVCTINDFFVRRTGLLYFNIDEVRQWKDAIAEDIGSILNWSPERKKQEVALLNELLSAASADL
ncbi:MAG TPA: glycerol-3-phosphate dehydrogenase/oxidase [Ohtaekwangia sp.]|nr:glycerol-3-phosphate dehydrogenase/oxidase [Ohtaekwangia sp.]